MSDKYRKNVGIVVFNQEKKVLLCARNDKQDLRWQFPQGGIEEHEDIETAARRELFEETSLSSVKTVFVTKECFRYDFPQYLKNDKYKGQEQYWVLFYFNGDNKEINLNTEHSEFRAYKWEDIAIAPKEIVNFKKGVYTKVVDIFEPLIKRYEV